MSRDFSEDELKEQENWLQDQMDDLLERMIKEGVVSYERKYRDHPLVREYDSLLDAVMELREIAERLGFITEEDSKGDIIIELPELNITGGPVD